MSCGVERTAGGADILSLIDGGEPKNSLATVQAVITLQLAGGEETVRFASFEGSETWLRQTFQLGDLLLQSDSNA